jgi:hypothetical protein
MAELTETELRRAKDFADAIADLIGAEHPSMQLTVLTLVAGSVLCASVFSEDRLPALEKHTDYLRKKIMESLG